MLINNATYQRETLSERPIRQPLNMLGVYDVWEKQERVEMEISSVQFQSLKTASTW